MTKSAILKRPLPAVIVLGALALGGCSGTNVGSSWQCPLARGGTCDSVATADPAVPAAAPADGMTIRKALYRERGEAVADRPPGNAEASGDCTGGCGFDPFGWLARLFGADRKDAAKPTAKPAPRHAVERLAGRAAVQTAPGPGDDPGNDLDADLPSETSTLPAPAEPADEDLRTEEVVARIWIAPFVDGAGVYREASHVRVVLEPAGWRVP